MASANRSHSRPAQLGGWRGGLFRLEICAMADLHPAGHVPVSKPTGLFGRFLNLVERAGNALPHPATLFILFALGVVIFSAILAAFKVSVAHPTSGEAIHTVSLLNVAGLHRFMAEMVTNFTSFAPLGSVLVALLGIAVCEHVGLISTALRRLVLAAPPALVPAVVVFAGVSSNIGGDIGYVLVIPLAGMVFHATGRHPIAGLAAAFAGVSGGYSANLIPGLIDPLLAGISTEAAHIIDPAYQVTVLANWYFMATSVFLVTGVGTWITVRIVEPRLGAYQGTETPTPLIPPSPIERRGLRFASGMALLIAAFTVWGLLPGGFLRDLTRPELLQAPFFRDLVAWIFFFGVLLGLAYGYGARVLRNDADIFGGMTKTMETMASYMVLVFFAAQFIALFRWTNCGIVIAVKGAELLQASGLGAIPLMLAFILLVSFVNLFLGSASAKWTLLAPVFIPMFMLLGVSPELVQTAYRIGDSSTNIITPLMSYFPIVLVMTQRYDRKAGLGTLLASMLPYSIAFLVTWSTLIVVWILLGWPVGPGAALSL